jgi:hypothetical protein
VGRNSMREEAIRGRYLSAEEAADIKENIV